MPSPHEFPERPVPAVSALVFRERTVLLVKRRDEPSRGLWSPPGGSMEVGETAEQAAVRETLEETGVTVRAREVVDVRDVIERTPEGRVRWHYVLLSVRCDWMSGKPFPATDAENARFIPLRELGEYELTRTAEDLLERVSGGRPA